MIRSIYDWMVPKEKYVNDFTDKIGIIYRITNLVEHKTYVGKSTRSFNQRYRGGKWWKHTHNKILASDFKRLGIDAFMVDIFSYGLSEEELDEMEQFLIRSHNCLHPNGYNMVIDAAHGKGKLSDISRQKMSDSAKIRIQNEGNPFKGRHHSDETKDVIRKKNSARIRSQEEIERSNNSKPKGSDHYLFGKPMSQERKDLLTKSRIDASRIVYQIDPKTRSVIREYRTVKEASEAMNACNSSSIHRSARSLFSKAYGFVWRYKDGSSPEPFDYKS